jgi:hypothetical protein
VGLEVFNLEMLAVQLAFVMFKTFFVSVSESAKFSSATVFIVRWLQCGLLFLRHFKDYEEIIVDSMMLASITWVFII